MSKKFIPNGDVDFGSMANGFAQVIAKEPARFAVSQEDSDALTAAVATFREALQAARGGATRSTTKTLEKELARGEAEQIIRRIANAIRANKNVDVVAKSMLRMRQRPTKLKQQTVPPEPPRLRFVRALHERNAIPMHELAFGRDPSTHARPEGAVRIELFVDLIPPDEPVPPFPGANYAGRPWYLRSYTRSPIVLTPPMPRVPMRVVYWGRWADSTGNVGPFSATAVGWIEGGTHALLPGGVGMAPMGTLGHRRPVPVLEDVREAVSDGRERTYVVAVLEAQLQSIAGPMIDPPSLPGPEEGREQRQLEAPRAVNEAA